jgi:hypothetical protein
LVKTWVSGGQSSELVEKLRREISELEEKREKLMEAQKSKIFEWASSLVRSRKDLGESSSSNNNIKLTSEIREILAEYDSITQTIFDKEVLLSERQDAQAKFDSLG